MQERFVRTIARSGLRLRDSPKDGDTIGILEMGSKLEILGEETWIKVMTESGKAGFVLGDYTEPLQSKSVGREPKSHEIVTYIPVTTRLSGSPLRISSSFYEKVSGMEQILDELNLNMWITSSFREPDTLISNAVVEAARLSNHFVGHALDMNLYADGEWFNSDRLGNITPRDGLNGEMPLEKVELFLHQIKVDLKLRWGGAFRNPDPVHIDDGLNVLDKIEYARKLSLILGG